GDCIDIGIYRLRFAPVGDAKEEALAQAVGEAMLRTADGKAVVAVGPEVPPAQSASLALSDAASEPNRQDRSAAEAALPDNPVLEYLTGPYAGITQRIDRNIVRIGDGDMQAAVIARRRPGWFVTHLEGMAMPKVNGVAIGLAASPLADGDLVELAGAQIRFRLQG